MNDIEKIRRMLKNHEERISLLEKRFIPAAKIKITKHSITDLILELKSEGFFREPRSTRDISQVLASKGRHYLGSSLTWPLQHAVRTRILGRIKKEGKWAYVER